MESNGVGGIFVGRGMSRASKQAKERENQSSDELVMAETVKHGRLKCQGPDIRGFWVGNPAVSVQNRADLVLQGPVVRLGARMSGPMARMSGPMIPDLVWGGNF